MKRYSVRKTFSGSSPGDGLLRHATRCLFALLLLVFPLLACRAAAAPLVAVPIPPLEWLVKELVGDAAEVALLVPPGASAEQYDPGPRELTRLGQARLYLALDIPVERRWLPRLTRANESLAVVALAIPAPRIDWQGEPLPGSGAGRANAGAEVDFHAWNSPRVMAAWIPSVVDALEAALPPDGRDGLRERATRVHSTLQELDRRLSERLEPYAGRAFLTLHPAWGYFAQAYGLEQLAIEAEGHEPGARTLSRLVEDARGRGIRQVYFPPRVDDRHVRQVADALGAETLMVDDLAPDYPQALERFAESLVRGFAP